MDNWMDSGLYQDEVSDNLWNRRVFELGDSAVEDPVSDSDGRNFPWYGGNKEIASVKGPSTEQTIEVRMTDAFAPRVTWMPPFYPQPSGSSLVTSQSTLTRILRDQCFITWLAAKNEGTGEMLVLATIKWRAFIDIAFNPSAPLGYRGTLVGDGLPLYQPEILPTNLTIPAAALHPPHANEAQVLVWNATNPMSRWGRS